MNSKNRIIIMELKVIFNSCDEEIKKPFKNFFMKGLGKITTLNYKA